MRWRWPKNRWSGQEIKVGDVVQYLFETQIYLDRDDAEEARAERVGAIARRFYAGIAGRPLAGARERARAAMSARGTRAAQELAARCDARRVQLGGFAFQQAAAACRYRRRHGA